MNGWSIEEKLSTFFYDDFLFYLAKLHLSVAGKISALFDKTWIGGYGKEPSCWCVQRVPSKVFTRAEGEPKLEKFSRFDFRG